MFINPLSFLDQFYSLLERGQGCVNFRSHRHPEFITAHVILNLFQGPYNHTNLLAQKINPINLFNPINSINRDHPRSLWQVSL